MSDRSPHPDSARLLALLDGELGRFGSWRARRHLQRCWNCRGRVMELQSAIAAAGRSLETTQPDADRAAIARARWNFRQAVAEFERAANPRHARRFTTSAAAAASAAALSVLLIGSFAFRRHYPESPVPVRTEAVSSADLLAALQAQELAPISAVREERFTVEIASSRSGPVRRELRVLSAPRAGLHAARWLDGRGVLQNAVFAADDEEDALYSRAGGLRPAVLHRPRRYNALYRTVAGSASSGVEALEAGILGWIGEQVWEPVSLARETAEFCSRSGAKLQIRRERGEWIWTAEAMVGQISLQLQLRGAEHRPVTLMEIAWQSGLNRGTVRLRRDRRQDFATLAAAPMWLRASGLRRAPEEPPAEAPQVRTVPLRSRQELLAAEVEALEALHRAGLCQRGGISVSGGHALVHVSGTVAGEAERERIETVIQSLPHAGLIASELQVMDPLAAVLSPVPSDRHAEQPSRAAAAESWLRARMGVGTRASEREMFSRMSLLISLSEDMLADAWAVEHLGRHFPAARQALLSAGSREVLAAIVRDHIRPAEARLHKIESLLALAHRSHAAPMMMAAPVWQEQAQQFRRTSQRLCEVMLSLFASSESTAAADANPETSELPGLLGQLRAWSPLLAQSAGPQPLSH